MMITRKIFFMWGYEKIGKFFSDFINFIFIFLNYLIFIYFKKVIFLIIYINSINLLCFDKIKILY